MTDDNTDSSNDKSRRSFVRDGALASGGLALGLSSAGTVSAQQNGTGNATEGGTATDDGGDITEGSEKGLIQIGSFNPNARFAFVSGRFEWTPSYGGLQSSWFSDYNTYMIRWGNTGNVVPFWVAQDADIGRFDSDFGFVADDEEPNQPQLYQMNREFTPFDQDNPHLLTVNFFAVAEDEEDSDLGTDDWWRGTGSETDDGLG